MYRRQNVNQKKKKLIRNVNFIVEFRNEQLMQKIFFLSSKNELLPIRSLQKCLTIFSFLLHLDYTLNMLRDLGTEPESSQSRVHRSIDRAIVLHSPNANKTINLTNRADKVETCKILPHPNFIPKHPQAIKLSSRRNHAKLGELRFPTQRLINTLPEEDLNTLHARET